MGYDLFPLIETDSTGLEMIKLGLREGNVIVSCNQGQPFDRYVLGSHGSRW
jgi:hypothetical protein